MDARYSRHSLLLDQTEAAYDRARREVYDRLPAGVDADAAALSPRQRAVLDGLTEAEAKLKCYRHVGALLVAV